MTATDRNSFTPGELSAIRVLFHQMVSSSNEDDLGVIMRSGAWRHLDGTDGAICRLADKLRATEQELDLNTLARAQIKAARSPHD